MPNRDEPPDDLEKPLTKGTKESSVTSFTVTMKTSVFNLMQDRCGELELSRSAYMTHCVKVEMGLPTVIRKKPKEQGGQ